MHDSASSLRPRTYGIQRRVPTPPMSDWPIKTSDQLPSHLKQQLEKLPPYLATRRANELKGGGRSKLYDDKDAGYIRCVKDGGTKLWETLSILIRLANLPAASAGTAAPQGGLRHSRQQPVSKADAADSPANEAFRGPLASRPR